MAENIDWNKYGVFCYLPPKQYGRKPDFSCAEYVLNNLCEFEKLSAVKPCDEDYRILNVYIYLQNEKSYINTKNLRNNQVISVGEKDRVRKTMSDEDFHEFMRYYIPTCPDDYFERIAAVMNMKHQTVIFKEELS